MSRKFSLTKTAQLLSSATKGEMDVHGKERIACQPDVVLQRAMSHTAARTAQAFWSGKSLTGLTSFRETLFHRVCSPLGDLLLQFGQQCSAAATRRKVPFDLHIPCIPVALAEPTGKSRLLLRREQFDRILDSIQCHTSNVYLSAQNRKTVTRVHFLGVPSCSGKRIVRSLCIGRRWTEQFWS
jgi:hypothetical protein